MWSTVVCVSAVAALAAANYPRCTHSQQCKLYSAYTGTREFQVEGNKVNVEFGKFLKVDCHGWSAFDSAAMPSFRSEVFMPKITLRSCPSPAADGSFLSVLSALNVTLQRSDEESILTLEELPQHPPLQALAHCDELQQLILSSPAVDALPEHWVASCPALELLSIKHANRLKSLTSKTLKNANSLLKLWVTDGVLETLEVGLLDDTPNLIFLNLSNNHLQILPCGLFAKQGALQLIDLRYNLLTPEGVAAVGEVHSLERLALSYNPRLTDLCNSSTDYSPLLQQKKLELLLLASTNITRICRDWRENMTSLRNMDLGDTQITELRFIDLQFIREDSISNRAKVYMIGTPVAHIVYSEEDYNASLVAPRSGAEVFLEYLPLLQCDCNTYWARRALFPEKPANSNNARIRGLKCASGRRLSDVPADELKCAA